LAGSFARRHRADHRAVGLRDDVGFPLRWPHAEGLNVWRLQLRARPQFGMGAELFEEPDFGGAEFGATGLGLCRPDIMEGYV